MMIEITIAILILAITFYLISYMSPRTDLIFYGIAAFLFLITGILGVTGFNEYPTNEVQTNVTKETIENGSTTVYVSNSKVITEESTILNSLFIIPILISIYMFSVLTIASREEIQGQE